MKHDDVQTSLEPKLNSFLYDTTWSITDLKELGSPGPTESSSRGLWGSEATAQLRKLNKGDLAFHFYGGRSDPGTATARAASKASGQGEFTRSDTRQEFRWLAEILGDFRYRGYELICRSPK